jgi:hypothetical protein
VRTEDSHGLGRFSFSTARAGDGIVTSMTKKGKDARKSIERFADNSPPG